jgi:uncharacterized protein
MPASVKQSCADRLGHLLKNNLLPEKAFSNPGPKVIHDPLWGSRLFYSWEIALIDTPLIQRLRQIHQLGTAYLTYPSAVHTRFSHSLGVTILAGRLITRLKEKAEISKSVLREEDVLISQKDINTVRMAGLLHDVGHCFFSHASEKALQPLILEEIKQEITPLNVKLPKPHEFLSYLIIKNPYFKKYWNENIKPLFYRDQSSCPDEEDIAKIIIGKEPSNDKRYLQEIISGPFDVDKLEYLYRDSRTAGLEISYDIERYFYKINLFSRPGNVRLAMSQGGVAAVEQIIFSKMMLFSFVYHHQKVLASDSIVSDLVMELLKSDNERLKIDHPVDMLKYTDYDLLAANNYGVTERFIKIRDKILNRELPKRCFVLSKAFLPDLKVDKKIQIGWEILLDRMRKWPDGVDAFREEIAEEMRSKLGSSEFSIDDVYINYPELPSIKEAMSAPILGLNNIISPMSEYYDLEGWQTTYDLKKLKGYFFVSEKYKNSAANVIEEYLRAKYNLIFDNNPRTEAKINSVS